jgi:hypothetical protein
MKHPGTYHQSPCQSKRESENQCGTPQYPSEGFKIQSQNHGPGVLRQGKPGVIRA